MAFSSSLKSREDGGHENPGWWLEEEDALKREPTQRYSETSTRTLYETWEVPAGKDLRLIRVHRTRKIGDNKQIQDGVCITDLPCDPTLPVAVALIMETRWWIEDTGFHCRNLLDEMLRPALKPFPRIPASPLCDLKTGYFSLPTLPIHKDYNRFISRKARWRVLERSLWLPRLRLMKLIQILPYR